MQAPPGRVSYRAVPLRIAFAGKMQVGKTTAADHLVASHGFRKYALADPIKEIARRDFAWDGAKDERGRRLLQEIGSVGRAYDPEIWLRRLAERMEQDGAPRVVVDDVRLRREVTFLTSLGFTVVRIDRPERLITTPTSGDRARHETETELDHLPFEATIANDRTIDDLRAAVDGLLGGQGTGT